LQLEYHAILIIDDEEFILEMISDILRGLGYNHVLTALNAGDAMQLIQLGNPPIDLVITDLNMPGVDGIELLRIFDETGYRRDLIIVSGEDEKTLALTETLARARNLSLLGKLAKPVHPQSLQKLLTLKRSNSLRHEKAPQGREISENFLAQGLANAEFEPWFQPKIDVLSRQPVGVEALARWPRSAQGPIFPDEFIPAAEHYGLITELTFQIARKVVRYGTQWRHQGLNLSIAINISMDSLHDQAFADNIYTLIAAQDDEPDNQPDNYVLEVTESRLMENLVTPLEALLRLRMKKLKLSIDDFGTGYSNLKHLKNFPFDELKLDRSFVQHYDDDRCQCILQSSIDVAHRLDMRTVAEGVESLNDWNRLSQLGCDQIQGYFVAKPMPGEEIVQWIEDWPKLSRQLFGDE